MSLVGVHRYPRHDQVVYGRPALEVLIELAHRYGSERLFVTTTRSLVGSDRLATRLCDALGARAVGCFADIAAHSPREAVIAAAEAARTARADLLIALGGGSVIDATKVVRLCLARGLTRVEQLDDYRLGGTRAQDLAPLAAPPMVAVPTTLSAAEFTPFAGVTDRRRSAKEGFAHPELAPRAVVLDPAQTFATPDELWLSTGIKAVDHAVEQLCHPQPAPFADALAVEGLRRLTGALRATKRDRNDRGARLEAQIGMWLAMSGIASGRGMGASHAIGHTLGGSYGVPHGITSAVMLHAVLRWNAAVAPERQRVVSAAMGEPEREAAECVRALCVELGLPTSLASIGIAESEFPAIAEHTMHDRSVRTNARPIQGSADIIAMLELAK